MRVLVLNGPNLNLLGQRESEVYGATTLPEVEAALDGLAAELGVSLEHFQSNVEGLLVDRIQAGAVAGVVINAGAYTHTSVAIRDALVGTGLPFVEIHVSNVAAREDFRHFSYLSDVAVGVVFGFGVLGYSLALRGLVHHLRTV